MEKIQLAVNGGLMRGMPSNHNLLDAGAEFVETGHTAPEYRLWSIDDRHPAMMRVREGGASIALEIWSMTPAGFVSVVQSEPVGLSVGKVVLLSGETLLGVVGEPFLCEGRTDITSFGGWRDYVESIAAKGSRQ